MPAFKVNVFEALAKAFDRLARSHGRARSKMLRGIIEQAVGDGPKAAALTRAPLYAPPTGRSIKVRVYLARDDADWVESGARGIVLKPERMALRQMRKRYEAGDGPKANVMAEADLDAATTFLKQDRATLPWEARIRARQEMVRSYYLQAADLLAASAEPTDQRLAHHVRYFIASMPQVTTRHQMLEDDHARAHFCGQRERGARTLERERVR